MFAIGRKDKDMTSAEIDTFWNLENTREDFIQRILDRLVERLKDVVEIEGVDGGKVSYRKGPPCRCSNRGCWYEYGSASIEEIFSDRLIPLMEGFNDES